MKFRRSRRPLGLAALLIIAISALLGAMAQPIIGGATKLDPVTAAWEKARASGSYHFTSDVTQFTLPLATLTNVGRGGRTEKLYLEGQNDLAAQQMELTLWSQGGSALQAESGIGLRTENGKTFTRRPGGDWQETDDVTGALAPQGDFLSYLAAIKDVQAQASENRGGIDFTRYTFAIDSPRFAAYLHKQMESALRARGELPPGLQMAVPTYFRDMVGTGELWIDADGLPLRQILTLQFPEQNDEQVNTQIVVNFSKFAALPVDNATVGIGTVGQWLTFDVSHFTQQLAPFALLMALFACALLLIYYRRTRLLQTVIVFLVIFAQVVGPLLTTYTNVKFFDAQTAKAAAAKERQAEAKSDLQIREALGKVEFNPHVNPLEVSQHENGEMGRSGDGEMAAQLPNYSITQAPAALISEAGLDTDGDTLSDFVEERIGTSEVISDTDSDGVRDNVEVAGFLFGGQRWYSDPGTSDSNGDGLGDAIEWGITDTGLRATPQDSDSDGFPDLFDTDNDGDGVPDNRDLAPFSKSSTTYDESTPLQLTLKNLTAGEPTFVDFQIRPTDAKQLWFAYNVLDWPQDSIGQVRDVDGKTYADVVKSGSQAAANDANGDMKVVPMLEIRIPTASANLPPQSDLTPFNISVNNFTKDGQTKVAYVPLSIVTDEKTGQRVAFSGQMRYLPNGIWDSPHEVRLSWVVQALVDMPCDPSDSAQVAQGCQSDGYIHNVAQPIQSYYSNWSLTGLGVREDHGATISVIYEDPSHDDNLKDDKAIWAISFVLDHHFVLGRDDNHDNQRDLTIDDLATRFDLDNNPTDAQRFDVPNILQVETQSYETLNQAVAATAMTSTVQILNSVFKPVVSTDRAIKPLLFFAQENSSRALTLDGATSIGYVTQSGGALTFDMAPSGKPAQTTSIIAGIKWMGYCAPTSGDVTLQPCTADQYWDELTARYESLPLEPGESDPDFTLGRLMMAQLYYMGMSAGYQGTVQDGATVFSPNFILESDDSTAATVRAVLRPLATAPLVADRAFGRLIKVYQNVPDKQFVGGFAKFYKSIVQTKANVNPLSSKASLKDIRAFFGAKNFRFIAAAAPLATIGTLIMVATQIVSMLPDLPPTTRSIVGGISIALNIGITVVMPIIEAGIYLQAGVANGLKILTQAFKMTTSTRIAGVVGLALSVLVTWGFFFYAMANGNLKAGDPALNRAFFEAVAATLVAVLLTILAVNPIGLIIGAIIGVIDLILTLLCQLGNKDLQNVPGMDGVCFSLTGVVTKYLSKLLYSYDLMVNMDRSDLMVTDAPQVDLADPAKGYVVGNTLSITLPVTTTIMHKNPDPNNGVLIYPYMYLFSGDNLKRSTFKYSLSKNGNDTPATDLDQMTASWQNLRERNQAEGGRYLVSPMYRADARSIPAPVSGVPLSAGINATVPFTLNMGYTIPAYECFLIVVVPVCYIRSYTGDNHMLLNSLQYDIFPATLSDFLALSGKPDSGLGQAWDAKFGSLHDADGDGLNSLVYNGLDPNDSSVDGDNDGLTDLFELQQQSGGTFSSPIQRDTDNDGLTDYQESRLGSDPARADSDNDGLKDGEEVYHLRYDPNTGLPTTTWEGGWDVTINANTPFVVRVSSDPFSSDSDNDGISDQAERQLAQSVNPADRLDNQNRPYHPTVFNTPPLSVFVETNDADNYLKPGQAFLYTSTVVANTAVVSGVLNFNVPTVLGSAVNPLALGFNPVTFSSAQTVTQGINLSVASNALAQQTRISSTASTRLPNSGSANWSIAPVVAEAPLAVPALNSPIFTALTAKRTDRQDQYFLSTFATKELAPFVHGDIPVYSLPDGSIRTVENDNGNTTALLNYRPHSMATNDNGDTLVVWGQQISSTVPLSDVNVLAGALLGSDGVIKRSITFPRSPVPSSYRTHSFAPTVSSNGSSFMVIYESITETVGGNVFSVPHIVAQRFDKDGAAQSSSYRAITGPVNFGAGNRLVFDSVWDGSNYRVLWQDRLGNSLYLTDVPANGQSVPAPLTIASDAYVDFYGDENLKPSLAYDPISGRTLVVFFRSLNQILTGNIYQGTTYAGSILPTVIDFQIAKNPQVTWNPAYGGWLVSYQNAFDPQTHIYLPIDRFGFQNYGYATGFGVNTSSNSLVCPAPQSAAVVDLRFEELPGVTSFADASGRGNHATCSGSSCPAAGFSGAPNAPLSDYAVQFDGVDDGLTITRTVQDSFTIAFWLKAPTSNGVQTLVDGGSPFASGFQIQLNFGALSISAGPNVQQSGRIDDGQWHFVTINRNAITGRLEAYVDGNRVISVFGTAGVTLNGVSDLRIGKNRSDDQPLRATLDHLQIIPAALGQDAVQALFNRTNQSYCVTAGASGSNLYWAKVQASQPDVRGGRISASNGLSLTIDSDLPTASFTALTNNEVVAPGLVIGGSANDATSGVALVEVNVNNGGWTAAEGTNAWAFSLAGYTGSISLQVRATDNVGNVGNASAAINLTIDSAAPLLSITAPTATVKPTKNAAGRWQVTINGTVSDAASGVKPDSLRVVLEPQTSNIPLQSEQTATLSGNNWSINYLLNDGLFDPTGVYSLTVQATDNIGNRATPATSVVRLDARAPEAQINPTDLTRMVISDTLTIGGIVSDTDSLVGIDKLEIAFATLEQLAALPTGLTNEQAEALLNRTWTPVTLASRGAGVATTTWTYQLPAGLENSYQIDLRGTDMLGNVAISSNLWRGIIDTTNPRVVMTATDTGVSYFDAASNRQQHAIRFVCAALDRNLDQDSFVCPGESLAEATRSYTSTAELQAIFPDLTIVNGLVLSYTTWLSSTTPAATARACDATGRCAQASTAGAVVAAANAAADDGLLQAAAVSATPQVVIVNPTNASFVAGSNGMSVTVAAEASGLLKSVEIRLDNALVQTLSFSQTAAITRTLRTVGINAISEGAHSVSAQVTDWAGVTQSALPVAFTLDAAAPSVTIDVSTLTDADTWQAQSGILRFNGTASDSIGLAAVQVRVGNSEFNDATFGGGTWRTAIYVADPEGRTLNVTVRAIDKAGRITQLNQPIGTNLSAASGLDTLISSGPANPSNVNSASFVFGGTTGTATFECQLDNGLYQPCASPTNYSGLSKGAHSFQVRAIDSRGFADLSPASYNWNVNAVQPEVFITVAPSTTTSSRVASFTFNGAAGAASFECALDGSAYSVCSSPKVYNNLSDGDHSFLVRAKTSGGAYGTATRFAWTVVNAAPLASSQTVVVIPNIAKSVTLTATDSDPLVYSIVTAPSHGTLLGVPPNLSYVPDTNYGGADSFTFKASDGQLDSNVATVTLFVDNVPPIVTCSATPNNIWTPNHKLVNIQTTVLVSDVHSGPAGFVLVSVTSNEPDAGTNKDDVARDIQNFVVGTPDTVGQLRAERMDTGSGRIYTLVYRGRDVAGNTTLCTTTVTVPKSQSGTLSIDGQTIEEGEAPFDEYVDDPNGIPEESTPDQAEAKNQIFLPVISNQ